MEKYAITLEFGIARNDWTKQERAEAALMAEHMLASVCNRAGATYKLDHYWFGWMASIKWQAERGVSALTLMHDFNNKLTRWHDWNRDTEGEDMWMDYTVRWEEN